MWIDPEMHTAESVARALRLAAHPLRLRILSQLVRHPGRCVCDLAAELGVEQPAVSHHLAALRTAGLVLPRREGSRVEYEIQRGAAGDLLGSLGTILGSGPRVQGARR
jgi:ArsR family transcriptional regulator